MSRPLLKLNDRGKEVIAMRSRLAAVLLGVAAVLGTCEPQKAEASHQAAYHWCYYGSYSCYGTACAKARYLQNCGYCTKIVCNGSCYAVYYH
jgi:hypothetical protein